MLGTRMTTPAFILSDLFRLDGFRFNSISALYPLEYNHDTSQICRTCHDSVSQKRMTTLAFILSELFLPRWFQMQLCVPSVT